MAIVILGIIIGGAIYYLGNDKAEHMSYTDFRSHVEKHDVISARIGDKEVTFFLEDEQKEYSTDNPDTDAFKEFLLLNGVKVQTEEGADELFVGITDMIFNVIFFGAIAFGLYNYGALGNIHLK
jgi:cell division protease FtsH